MTSLNNIYAIRHRDEIIAYGTKEDMQDTLALMCENHELMADLEKSKELTIESYEIAQQRVKQIGGKNVYMGKS